MKSTAILVFLLLILSLTACSGTGALPATPDGTKGSEGITIPTAEAGKAVVTGKLTDKSNNTPLASQLVRLAKIFGEGKDSIYVYNESADPGSFTVENGSFVVTEVEPGSYAIIIVDPSGNYSPINETGEKIVTVDVTAGQVIDMGNIMVDLSASGN